MSVLVAVPSRGRPSKMLNCARAILDTARGEFALVVLVDEDDPCRTEYEWIPGIVLDVAPRLRLVPKLNLLAERHGAGHSHMMFMGDDHCCVTEGWDVTLVAAAGPNGIAYGNDLIQGEKLPTAVMLSMRIVEAIGYAGPPELQHLYIDDFWRDLGQAAGCLTYVPGVVIRHDHPIANRAEWDDTYEHGNSTPAADRAAYDGYLATRFDSDVEKVRALCG